MANAEKPKFRHCWCGDCSVVNRREEKKRKRKRHLLEKFTKSLSVLKWEEPIRARGILASLLSTPQEKATFLSACSWNAGVWDIVICTFGGSWFLLGYWAAQDQPTNQELAQQ